MKILHYISHFNVPSQTFLYDLLNNLELNSFDNYVLTHKRSLEKETPFPKVYIVSNKVSFLKKVYHRLFDMYNIRNQKKIVDYINNLSPQIIHAHFGPNGVKMAKLLKKYDINIPLVISMHGADTTAVPLNNIHYRNELKKLSSNRLVLFTFPSLFLKEKFEENINVKLNQNAFVVPNSFNKIFYNQKVSYFQHTNNLQLVCIGRLIKLKGFKYLLEAVSLLNENYNNWELSILGDGDLKVELMQYAKNLGVDDKVKFYGFVKHNQVSKILLDSDIYIQPSIVDPITGEVESFGVSVIEAILTGLPVIVTNVGGLPSTVLGGDEKFAIVVEQQNAKSIASAINMMIENNIFQDNETFRKKIVSEYSQQKQIINMTNIYSTLLNTQKIAL